MSRRPKRLGPGQPQALVRPPLLMMPSEAKGEIKRASLEGLDAPQARFGTDAPEAAYVELKASHSVKRRTGGSTALKSKSETHACSDECPEVILRRTELQCGFRKQADVVFCGGLTWEELEGLRVPEHRHSHSDDQVSAHRPIALPGTDHTGPAAEAW
jgi:hypothetical protein